MKVLLEKKTCIKRWAQHNFENSVKSMLAIERKEIKGKPWHVLYNELKEMAND